MSHLAYYQYQAVARGITGPDEVRRRAEVFAYVYDRLVLPWFPRDRAGRVVELACGHGSFLHWLKQRGFTNCRGVDSSAEQIVHARSAGGEVIEAEAIAWLEAQPAASVELLVAIDFIEHISKDDFMRVLAASHRVLVPGGRLILRYPNGDSPFVGLNLFNDITHIWTYTTNCLTSLAQMHGFARCRFVDEGAAAIRDHRWLKVPLSLITGVILRLMLQTVSREKIKYWNSCIWACLEK